MYRHFACVTDPNSIPVQKNDYESFYCPIQAGMQVRGCVVAKV